MNATFDDAVEVARAAASGLGKIEAQPSKSPLEDWPEQAIDACAPEGGYSPDVSTAHGRPNERWS
jgi:hypothetical protein